MRTPFTAALLFVSISVAAQQAPAPQPTSVEGAVTHVYKSIDDIELRLHVFNPPGHSSSMKRAAMVFFFGGGWTAGSIGQFVPQSRHLASRGMVAIVADYRVFGRHKTSPFDAMADARSAGRWVRSQAKDLGVDPDRIAAGGGSAGGHIALSTAVFSKLDSSGDDMRISPRPDALVLFNPVVDTSLSRAESRFGARATEGSPLHHLGPGLPPTVILHGKADATVPYGDVEKYCAEARKLGNKCELVGYDDATHGFFNPGREKGKWHRETLSQADRFLTELGYLPQLVMK
jgi:acetyl esterase/lipase